MAETSTRQFVEIKEIKDDILILKDGSLKQVIKVGSTNFELKSQDEQMAVLRGFQELLNTLEFSLEIMVMSRKLNIDRYLGFLNELAEAQQNELMRIQAVEYSKFVKELTQMANIMSKDFFVVVPFHIGPRTKGGIGQILKSFFSPAQGVEQLTADEFDSYKTQLSQRVGLVYENLASLGLGAKILNNEELLDVFYRFYNPEAIEGIKQNI